MRHFPRVTLTHFTRIHQWIFLSFFQTNLYAIHTPASSDSAQHVMPCHSTGDGCARPLHCFVRGQAPTAVPSSEPSNANAYEVLY
uniref:Putative secreted protein n=1 Tax=Ixodes ricinus TaxID=34613 RepID=A0A6B0UEV9_IXORI